MFHDENAFMKGQTLGLGGTLGPQITVDVDTDNEVQNSLDHSQRSLMLPEQSKSGDHA